MPTSVTETQTDLTQIPIFWTVCYFGDWPRCLYFRTEEAQTEQANYFREHNKNIRSAWIDSHGTGTLAQAIASYQERPGYESDPRLLFPEIFPALVREAEMNRSTQIAMVRIVLGEYDIKIIAHGRMNGKISCFNLQRLHYKTYLHWTNISIVDDPRGMLEAFFFSYGHRPLNEMQSMLVDLLVEEITLITAFASEYQQLLREEETNKNN